MRGQHAALAAAMLFAFTAPASAQENPWSTIKRLFHEPVSKIIQELERPGIKPAVRKAKPAKKEAGASDKVEPEPEPESEAPAEQAEVPIPRPRPDRAVVASEGEPAQPESTFTKAEMQSDEEEASAPDEQAASPVDTASADVGKEMTEASKPGAAVLAETSEDEHARNEQNEPQQTEPEQAEAQQIEPGQAGSAQAEADVPIPRARPEIVASYAPSDDAERGRSAAAIGALTSPGEPLVRPPPAASSTCGAELARLGVDAAALAPISEGSCGVSAPVALASLGGGATDLTAKAITECQMAETFANWIREEVQPRAKQMLGGDVTGLRVAASYDCRNRNGRSDTKLSEHAKGNAIDISAFEVAGHGWITVGGGHKSSTARFIKEVRKSACGPFKTVLGPGSDSYHSDHFHLDLAKRNTRGRSKGLYCR